MLRVASVRTALLLGVLASGCDEGGTESPPVDAGELADAHAPAADAGPPLADASTTADGAWPTPGTLRVVQREIGDDVAVTFAAMQGLVNRRAPSGSMIYLERPGTRDREWREYYERELGLHVVATDLSELLDWARTETDIRHFIVVDYDVEPPATVEGAVDRSHACTVAIAQTLAGLLGNAVPVRPDSVALLERQGFTLLPDTFLERLGPGGAALRTPDAFDLRNQWRSRHDDAPWSTRQDAYRWAIDVLLPLAADRNGVTNDGAEALDAQGAPGFWHYPLMTDYSIGLGQFHFQFLSDPFDWFGSTNPAFNRTSYDGEMYAEVLATLETPCQVRGWPPSFEGPNIQAISEGHCFHAGNGGVGPEDLANASVHAAVSPSFDRPFVQPTVVPEEVTLDPNAIYLTFTVSDGDQLVVTTNLYEGPDQQSLWNDPARGQIPINWSANGLHYDYARGVLRRLFDEAAPTDTFVADVPVGYGHFTAQNFGADLVEYDRFADAYLARTGMSLVGLLNDWPTGIMDETIQTHVRELTNATAFREGYSWPPGVGWPQSIHWPEGPRIVPYMRNSMLVDDTVPDPAGRILELAARTPLRPLFMHVLWQNWQSTPSEMQECMGALEDRAPGGFELVGMSELVALAERAKQDGVFPLEMTAGWETEEWAYLWSRRDGSVASCDRDTGRCQRTTSGGATATYKFNVRPSTHATLTADIAGASYRLAASPDDAVYTEVAVGQSAAPTTETVDLSGQLSDAGTVYVRLSGEAELFHLRVEY